MMEADDLVYFRSLVNLDELETFIRPRIFSRDIILDDPIDFINGFSLALSFLLQGELDSLSNEAKFRIGFGIWLKKFIDEVERIEWKY